MGAACQHDPSVQLTDCGGQAAILTGELQLYLNLNASRQVQGHEGLHSLLVGVEDIDQSLVGSALKLLAGILILMDSPQDGHNLFLGGQRDGTGDGSAVALGGFYDLRRAGIDELVIIWFAMLMFPP